MISQDDNSLVDEAVALTTTADPMPRRFQFSLGQLMVTATLLSVAIASASVLVRESRFALAPILMPIAIGSFGVAMGILNNDKKAAVIIFGTALALLAFGLLACAGIRLVE